ncbi:MAG: hypothetical protein ABR905_15020 [Terracidiphilus sp.]
MRKRRLAGRDWRGWLLAAVLGFGVISSSAQQTAPPAGATAQTGEQSKSLEGGGQKTGKHITHEQALQLFALVDQLIKFSSDETGLPIKSEVKRQITDRATVENYLKEKFAEDESAKRMQRGEIVLKKFGLLDRDFALSPFLLQLLKEQIEAYYDFKTKTVYMLDWVDIEEQKPVLAHELTHALQDQHSNLEKWNDQTPDQVSLNYSDDTDHLARDEMDTAREAVVEGQATAVMMDYVLKPMGKSLVKDPELMDVLKQKMTSSEDSPVLARAPLLLSESLLFPYREGLSFEQDVWMDQGQTAAFTGTLDRPPTSSWEIINPREYEKRHVPSVPLLPNIHPLVDSLYKPYDIGQLGQLDMHILAEIFGGDEAAANLTPAWDGGLYWAGQRLSAKTLAERASTNSIALFYLTVWKNAASAQAFTDLYIDNLGRKYSSVKLQSNSEGTHKAGLSQGVKVFPPPAQSSQDPDGSDASALPGEQVYSTSEGPVVITTRDKMVFVSESFPLDVARKLTAQILDAQGTGATRLAQTKPSEITAPKPVALEPLTGNLVQFFSDCGVMKAAVEAVMQAGR